MNGMGGMNIGSMMRAMLGETLPAENAKALELRIGQIVRGVLIEMLDQREGLVNINGIPVRAKLEADMPLGRGTLLQVQQGSSGGAVTLKPLAETSETLPDETVKSGLKAFGLPDQRWSHELIRGLKRDGYPIGKETAAFYQNASSLKPAGADSPSWMAAADVAFRRGLAASEETLSSLRQALFGQPIHEEIASLADALKQWQQGGGAKTPQAAELAVRLQTLLAEGESLLAKGEAQLLGRPAETGEAGSASGSRPAAAAVGMPATPANANGSAGGSPNVNPQAAANGGPERQGEPAARLGAMVPRDADVPDSTGRAAGNPAPAGRPSESAVPAGRPEMPVRDAISGAANAASRPDASWIGRFMQWLGAGHENQLLHSPDARHAGGADSVPAGYAVSPGTDDGTDGARAGDTLKSALMALVRLDDAPPALREAAQNLVHQISGQQLLLVSERQTNAPFSMMTLFIPMKGQDGESTAAVHVQARKSRRGEWDTDNCRLLFDLRMKHLGDTIVDVQVVDRIVSVKLLNDFPRMADLAEQARDELNAGLRAAGFQLLSLTSQPLPVGPDAAPGSARDKSERTLPAGYAAKPYRGVDYRA